MATVTAPPSIPAELRAVPNWVLWRWGTRDGKPTKIPYDVHSVRDGVRPRLAKTNNMATWASFNDAVRALEGGGFDGLGFVLGSGVCGVDLDKCRDPETGVIDEWARAPIDRLKSYTEVSPSGTGVHVIVLASLPSGGRRRDIPDARPGAKIEAYDQKRFFCMTGNRLPDAPATIEERQAGVAELHREFFGPKAKPTLAKVGRAEFAAEPDEAAPAATEPELRARLDALISNDPDVADAWNRRNPKSGRTDLSSSGWAQCLLNLLAHRDWARPELEWACRHFYATQATQPGDNPLNPAKLGHTVETALRSVAEARACAADAPHLTDTGNALRLVAQHGADLRHCQQLGGWLVWDGKRWVADHTGEVARRAKAVARAMLVEATTIADEHRREELAKHALRSESNARVEAMIALARSESAVAVTADVFGRDLWALNVANGTLDLKTGTLRQPHRREDLLTKMSPVAYYPNADRSLWLRFLRRATCGDPELMRFLQKVFGLCLTGVTSEEVMLFIHGPTRSGKTTCVETLKRVLGDYAVTTRFDTFADTRYGQANAATPDVARLAGARLVAAVESSRSVKLNAELVKWLTGGDTLAARALYKDTVEFRPTFKLLLASNERPKLPDGDEAVWRRVREVQFPHTIPDHELDPSVKLRLGDPEDGAPGVLAWAVEGCLLWQREGLGAPPAVRAATAQYRDSMNPLRPWLDERCFLGADKHARLEALWQSWRRWCDVNDVKSAVTHPEFRERLRALGCEPARTETERFWTGIGLVTEDDLAEA